MKKTRTLFSVLLMISSFTVYSDPPYAVAAICPENPPAYLACCISTAWYPSEEWIKSKKPLLTFVDVLEKCETSHAGITSTCTYGTPILDSTEPLSRDCVLKHYPWPN